MVIEYMLVGKGDSQRMLLQVDEPIDTIKHNYERLAACAKKRGYSVEVYINGILTQV